MEISQQPRFSILTPAYNRAHLLGRLWASLEAQTLGDFEWIVVDDGSADNSRTVVKSLAAKAAFPVMYIYQANAGKHAAVNAGVRVARGSLVGILDSDDRYTPNALNSCWEHWQQISAKEQGGCVGLTALCEDEQGRLIGDRFPADLFDSDALECSTRFKIKGDKKGFQRTDVLRQFPFPEDLGGFVPEGIVWNRIARQFKTRYVNEVWTIMEYQRDGLSAHSVSTRVKSPRAASLYYEELLDPGRNVTFSSRIRNSANLWRFSLHARSFGNCGRVPRAPLAISAPLGVALYLRDKIKLAM